MVFDQYTKFLTDILASKVGEAEDVEQSSVFTHCISHLLTVYEKAIATGCVTECIACRYVSFYLQLGRIDEARKLAEKLCSGKLSDSVQLWLLRVSLESRYLIRNSQSPRKAGMQSIFEILKGILTKVSASEAESLWHMVCFFKTAFIVHFNPMNSSFSLRS